MKDEYYSLSELADAIGTGNRIEELMPDACPICGKNPSLESSYCHKQVLIKRIVNHHDGGLLPMLYGTPCDQTWTGRHTAWCGHELD